MLRTIYKMAYDGKPEGFSNAEFPNDFLGTFEVVGEIEHDNWSEEFVGIRKEDGKKYIVSGVEKGIGVGYSIIELEATTDGGKR